MSFPMTSQDNLGNTFDKSLSRTCHKIQSRLVFLRRAILVYVQVELLEQE